MRQTTSRSWKEDSFKEWGNPLNIAIWSKFLSDCMWTTLWIVTKYEQHQRLTMNYSSPHTEIHLLETVQEIVKELTRLSESAVLNVPTSPNSKHSDMLTPMFDDTEYWRKEHKVSCIKYAREVASFVTASESAEERIWWPLNPNRPKGKWDEMTT